jgi:pSer/pThr/pTyr-binding forkhead associated (FHA) protein
LCILGSLSRVHLPLHSPVVSRTHAMIVVDDAEAYIRDLASRNGLVVNGTSVREAKLHHGDLICIGPFAYWWTDRRSVSHKPRHLALGVLPVPSLSISGEARVRPLHERTVLIGSRDNCDVQIPLPHVETAHAVLYRVNGEFRLRDLNSASGTFVNGKPIRRQTLQGGEEIQVAHVLMKFEPPPEVDSQPAQVASEESTGLTGLMGIINSDHPPSQNTLASQPRLTIEELLGAPSTRITIWQTPDARLLEPVLK